MDRTAVAHTTVKIVENSVEVLRIEPEIEIVRHGDVVQLPGDVAFDIDRLQVEALPRRAEGHHRQILPAVKLRAVGVLQPYGALAELLAGEKIPLPIVGVTVEADQDAVETEPFAQFDQPVGKRLLVVPECDRIRMQLLHHAADAELAHQRDPVGPLQVHGGQDSFFTRHFHEVFVGCVQSASGGRSLPNARCGFRPSARTTP